MASYVPNHQKKRELLVRREIDLLDLLEQGGTSQTILRAAGEVRAARVRVLLAERARLPPCSAYEEKLRALDEKIACTRATGLEAIIEEIRARPAPPE